MRLTLFARTLLLVTAFLLATAPLGADDKAVAGDDDLVRDVKKAIDEGVSFLRSQQLQTDGSWEVAGMPSPGSGGGTALAIMAMLNAGVKANDKAIQRGLKWMRANPAQRTYAAGLQTMAFCMVNDPDDKKRIEANVKWLVDNRMADGWSYSVMQLKATGSADNSNTQYAMLGIHEANQKNPTGLAVDRKMLEELRDHFIKTQHKSGGWGYKTHDGARTNMTTAGLCNLIISGLDLAEGKAALRKDGSAEKCGEYAENEAVSKAVTWIGDRFPAQLTNADAVSFFAVPYYGLYGIERAGRLTGQRYFGGHDWYEIGCRWLVKAQKADGSWLSPSNLEPTPVVATSFALLFLTKGRTPVLVSKLAYGAKDYMGWNNKRNDMKNLVDYVSRELFNGTPLAWQAFDARHFEANTEVARRKLAAELAQSPIAFINGHDYAPRDKEEEILKEFINNGGFVLAENCCGADRHPAFDKDFRRMIKRILPDAELKLLEPEHAVWTASGKFASSPREFPLWGVKQGCKTVVIYSPVPLAGYWEANGFSDKGKGQRTFELAANIVAYATGMEVPRPRLSRVEIVTDSPKEKPKRGYLQVAQLRHEGDWQPAPHAMRNLMVEARKNGLDVVLKTQPVFPSEEAVLDYRFLYMHGRSAFTAKKEDLKDLRFHLKNGGTLLADACCGADGFDTSFRTFMQEMLGDDKLKLEPILAKDDLFGADLNGSAIDKVRRRVREGKSVSKEFASLPPALEGIKYKGRWVVIYSKVDIGCALEKHASSECLSHDYDSALRLARAAMLYGLKR